MYFSIKRHKEIVEKANALGGYYCAEFEMGYMMTHHFWEWIADFFIGGIPAILIILLFMWLK